MIEMLESCKFLVMQIKMKVITLEQIPEKYYDGVKMLLENENGDMNEYIKS